MDFGVLVDVSASIFAVMMLFSMSASSINELIADSIRNLRGKGLQDAVRNLLEKHADPKDQAALDDLVGQFYRQPGIAALMEKRSWLKRMLAAGGMMSIQGSGRPPSAIEPRQFAVAALEVLGRRDALAATARSGIEAFRDEATRAIAGAADVVNAGPTAGVANARIDQAVDELLRASETLRTSLDRGIEGMEKEFTLTMDRVSGWYVRRVRTNLFFIGLILAVGANVDFLRYANRLMTEADLSQRVETANGLLAELAPDKGVAADPANQEAIASVGSDLRQLADNLGQLDVRVGWHCVAKGPQAVALPGATLFCPAEAAAVERPSLSQMICWLLVAFGVTLGAQFWFDLFRRLVNLRTAGVTGGVAEATSSKP